MLVGRRFVEGWDELCVLQLAATEAAEEHQRTDATPPCCAAAPTSIPHALPCTPMRQPSSPPDARPRVVLSTYPQGYEGEASSVTLPSEGDRVITMLQADSFGSDGECLPPLPPP